jgi:hypothetical protein
VLVGHDYKANGTREATREPTIGYGKAQNIQLKAETAKERKLAPAAPANQERTF